MEWFYQTEDTKSGQASNNLLVIWKVVQLMQKALLAEPRAQPICCRNCLQKRLAMSSAFIIHLPPFFSLPLSRMRTRGRMHAGKGCGQHKHLDGETHNHRPSRTRTPVPTLPQPQDKRGLERVVLLYERERNIPVDSNPHALGLASWHVEAWHGSKRIHNFGLVHPLSLRLPFSPSSSPFASAVSVFVGAFC